MGTDQWAAFSATLNMPPREERTRRAVHPAAAALPPSAEGAAFMAFYGAVTGQPGVSSEEVSDA